MATLYFSKRTLGFYSSDVHDYQLIPDDAVEITEDEWKAAIIEQAGGQMGADENGKPKVTPTIDPSTRTEEKLIFQAKQLLLETDLTTLRFLERGAAPVELRVYREALREVVRGHAATLPPTPVIPSLKPAEPTPGT